MGKMVRRPNARPWDRRTMSLLLVVWGLVCSSFFVRFRYGTAAVAAPQPFSPLRRQRGLQQEEEESPAYIKCFDTLDAITAGGSTLSQSQYVTFLSQMDSTSTPPSRRFGDLDAIYILIFYLTACEDATRCAPAVAPPTIPIGDTATPSGNVRLLCRAVMRASTTRIDDAMFQYSIQYDARVIDDSKLGECLSTATVNAILDVLGCDALTATRRPTRRRREDDVSPPPGHPAVVVSFRNFLDLMGNDNDRSPGRMLQVGDVVSSIDDDSCAYLVSSSVEAIDDVECQEGGADVGTREDDAVVECGLVRALATVATNQFVEPFATVLRATIMAGLREIINSGRFLQYFPTDASCFLSDDETR